jgi:DNA-binding NtrC family response regulator
MPGFNGLEALRVFQESGLDLPFILVSGKIGEEQAVEVMKAGAHDYIMKDRLYRLVPAIRRELVDAQVRRERRQAEAPSVNLKKDIATSSKTPWKASFKATRKAGL